MRTPLRHVFTPLSAVAGVILLLIVATGCSPQTRHEILTVFFTGVPSLEERQNTAGNQTDRQKEQASKAKKDTRADRKKPTPAGEETAAVQAPPKRPLYYSHVVWLEGGCSSCHEGNAIFGFQGGRLEQKKVTGERVFYAGGGMPGPLLKPKEKLCTGCHTDKTAIRAIKDELWLHNTTARGDCLACHEAHQSKHAGVLRRPPEQLCQPCHPAEKLSAQMHRKDNQPCLTCHNPHMGKDKNLLTSEYQETKQTIPRTP